MRHVPYVDLYVGCYVTMRFVPYVGLFVGYVMLCYKELCSICRLLFYNEVCSICRSLCRLLVVVGRLLWVMSNNTCNEVCSIRGPLCRLCYVVMR